MGSSFKKGLDVMTLGGHGALEKIAKRNENNIIGKLIKNDPMIRMGDGRAPTAIAGAIDGTDARYKRKEAAKEDERFAASLEGDIPMQGGGVSTPNGADVAKANMASDIQNGQSVTSANDELQNRFNSLITMRSFRDSRRFGGM